MRLNLYGLPCLPVDQIRDSRYLIGYCLNVLTFQTILFIMFLDYADYCMVVFARTKNIILLTYKF